MRRNVANGLILVNRFWSIYTYVQADSNTVMKSKSVFTLLLLLVPYGSWIGWAGTTICAWSGFINDLISCENVFAMV